MAFKKASAENRLAEVIRVSNRDHRCPLLGRLFRRIYKTLLQDCYSTDVGDLRYTLRKITPPISPSLGRGSKFEREAESTSASIPRRYPNIHCPRLVRPSQLQRSLVGASKDHGGKCVGLAVGMRARIWRQPSWNLSSSEATLELNAVSWRCLYMYRNCLLVQNRRNDLITIRRKM